MKKKIWSKIKSKKIERCKNVNKKLKLTFAAFSKDGNAFLSLSQPILWLLFHGSVNVRF